MIRKLRFQIILTMMTVFFTLLLIILISTHSSTKSTLEASCLNQLQSAIHNTYSSNSAVVRYASTPLLVLSVDHRGNIKILQNEIDCFSEDDISTIVQEILTGKTKISIIRGNYRYIRESIGLSDIRIALADIQVEQNILKHQKWQFVIIALISIFIFGIVSTIFSNKLTRPIYNTMLSQREFIANASHKLKTPITIILSNAEMVSCSFETHENDTQNTRQRITFIQNEALRMKNLVEQLLQLAKLDSDTVSVPKEKLDFSFLVNSTMLTYEPIIYDLNRKLNLSCEDDIYVIGNAENLRQVLDILIDNAIKYSTPDSSINVSLHSVKHNAFISVENYGSPLSPEDAEQVFQKFYRLSKNQSGYGLGLPIAKSIIIDHNGIIKAESDGISKNTFIIQLPKTTPLIK